MIDKYKDKVFNCKDCSIEFIWSAGEQMFLNSLLDNKKIPFVAEPTRCYACKKQRDNYFKSKLQDNETYRYGGNTSEKI